MQVVVTRLNVAPIIKARSKCLSCGEVLRAFDLMPVISYIFLKGKCRYCKSAYGISNLLIEVIYGLVFVGLYHFILANQFSGYDVLIYLFYYSVLFITLGVMTMYDYNHTYIPISYLFTYCILTFGMLIVRYVSDPTIINLLAPIIVASPFLIVWLVTKGRGIGFGDVLLFLGIGAFFGLEGGLAVLLVSIWSGAIVGIIIYILRRRNNIKSTVIPFVPFIVFAFLFVLFSGIDIFSISNLFA